MAALRRLDRAAQGHVWGAEQTRVASLQTISQQECVGKSVGEAIRRGTIF